MPLWSELNNTRKGRCAEYLVCMQLSLAGVDVYRSEVDDRGIDFVIRCSREQKIKHYDIQVKSGTINNWLFVPKDKFIPRENLLLALAVFRKNADLPLFFLIPSLDIPSRKDLFTYRPYKGKKTKPEWGITPKESNIHILEKEYNYKTIVSKLFSGNR